MDKLTVKTNTRLRKSSDLKSLSIIFVILSAVIIALFYVNVKNLLIYEGLLAIALGWAYYRSVKNGDVTLSFKGDSLEISYPDGRKYDIRDVDRSYFTLTQTASDRKHGVGRLSVTSTNFRILYIEDFDAVREYVNTHFERVERSGIYYLDDEDEDEENE